MFKHFIRFLTLPSVGTIEISEPIGFDKASYKVKQDDKRFGRDIIIANEDTELTFTRDFFEQLSIMQTLPNGEVINHASLGFDYLVDVFNNDGWEGKIEYIIEQDNVVFSTGVFSYATAMVDFDSIKVKIIQNTNREIIKRLEDTDVNAFNDKALDGRTITPCATTNILLKAKPIVENSQWINETKIYNFSGGGNGFNPFRQIIKSGIRNTLTPFEDQVQWNFTGSNPFINFSYVNAATYLSNIIINFKLKGTANRSGGSDTNIIYLYCFKCRPADFQVNFVNAVNRFQINLTSLTTVNFDANFSINLNDMEIGERIYCYFYYSRISGGGNISISFQESEFNISVSSTSIDTVVKGVRLIDLAKHNTQSLADVQLIAPQYDLGGKHYDNFAFNGLLLGQITDKPFNNKFKDLMNFAEETCSDIQINPTTVELLPYEDFYQDVEMEVFDEIPSFDASSRYNKRYSLKTADFKYKRSSDNRATNGENSIDDVHTETQKFITENVDANLKVEINHIRSAFLIEEARRRAFDNEQTKSLENDDNLFLLKCVTLPPSSQGGFSAVLLMRTLTGNKLEILNNNTDGNGINFNWTLLGFNVGSQFFIDAPSQNAGNYTVLTITTSVLTLQRVSGTPTFNGDAFIKMRWFYTDVVYTNQTDETYTLIEGVANPSDYSNLDYHWARNIKHWYKYLATATKFKIQIGDVIKTASFKTNGLLRTQKTGESAPLGDSDDIANDIIATEKILTPLIHQVRVYSDFEKTTRLIQEVQTEKGYVTVKLDNERTIKGYIKEMDYTWVTEELDLTLEEKYEGDYMNITSGLITYPQYPSKNNLASFQVNNIFVLLFDNESKQMYPPIRFTKVKINGQDYTDLTLFTDALTDLINE